MNEVVVDPSACIKALLDPTLRKGGAMKINFGTIVAHNKTVSDKRIEPFDDSRRHLFSFGILGILDSTLLFIRKNKDQIALTDQVKAVAGFALHITWIRGLLDSVIEVSDFFFQIV